jgi:MFS family permease
MAIQSATSTRLTPRLRAILAVVLIADVLDLMDSTITNIAAPTIVREIGGGEALIKWLGASYALALGVLLVVGGRLGDRFGQRRMFLIGIAGFTLASLAAGLSLDPAMLIVSRLLQGGFGALLIPQGIGLLLASFSREQLPAAFSLFGPVLGGSAVLGPITAGFLISANLAGLTWRPAFLINIVLGTIGFLAALRLLPRDTIRSRVRIDGVGAALLGLAMVALIYGLIDGSTDGWIGASLLTLTGTWLRAWTSIPILSLAAGVVAFLLFALRQRTARHPLILPSLLTNRGFTAGMLLGLGYFAAVSGFAYVVSLFFQLTLGLSTAQAALALSPLMGGIILSSFFARPLIATLGRKLVVGGLAVSLAGAGAIFATVLLGDLLTGGKVGPYWMAPALLLFGLGMGACFSSIFDVAVGDVALAEAGSASGALSAVQQLANAIGSAVITTVFFDQLTSGGIHAMTVSITVVGAVIVVCLCLVRLLPQKASAEEVPEKNADVDSQLRLESREIA